ncbi:hypothetical protein AB0J42_17655 [Nonomuraea sp. NPDC049649]|uniref:hypothetical protein n=1 Tax=Nonomuraea sp. NPDC049649 TaxID=3155776 RepID=UPI00341BF768
MGAVVKAGRRSDRASDVRWAFGCGFPVVIGLAFATLGTVVEIRLVAQAHVHCVGDLTLYDLAERCG